jgi:hypothetical protein
MPLGTEDIDVDVLVGTIFGSTVAAIPGMHLLASSVLSGSANAFLTLRVGMITKEYCRCTVRVEKAGLRRAATLKAVLNSQRSCRGNFGYLQFKIAEADNTFDGLCILEKPRDPGPLAVR